MSGNLSLSLSLSPSLALSPSLSISLSLSRALSFLSLSVSLSLSVALCLDLSRSLSCRVSGVHPDADLAGRGPLLGLLVVLHQLQPENQLPDLLAPAPQPSATAVVLNLQLPAAHNLH